MTPERFRILLQTYGADLRRWPQAECTSARTLLAQGPPELRELRAESELLDRWLDSHKVAAPGSALIRRVVADAEAARPGSAAPGRWQAHRWWAGAGLLGIGVAGTLAGAMVVSVALRTDPPAADWPERGTAFSGFPADWSEE